MKMNRTRPHGFVLVVAVLLLVLTAAVAELAMRLALSESLAASYEVAEQRADYVAEAGLARTASFLTEMARREVDFDRALDPNLDTTCGYSSSSALVTTVVGGGSSAEAMAAVLGILTLIATFLLLSRGVQTLSARPR